VRVIFADNLLLDLRDDEYRFDLQPHLGLISLIATIEAAGHEGVLYDPKLGLARGELPLDSSLYRRMADDILAAAPDVVGFTTLGCNFICTIKVAGHIRRLAPEIPLLLGGPHASILHREIATGLRQFDAIVRNEAEATIVRILEACRERDFADIPGVTYCARDGLVENPGAPMIEDLDELPWPAYHSYPIERLDGDWLRVEAGRGCPFSCTFCSTASFFGRRYRLKSSSRLCAELDHLHERYDVSHFSLTHDLFTVNKHKVAEFCDAVRDRGYTWTCSARMDCVTPELLERMSDAGCRSIYYGVETGSTHMQKVVRKRLDLSLFFPTLAATERLGMAATASFITGYPDEQQEDQDATLDLIGSAFYRCAETLMVQLHLLTPEPGTRLMEQYGGRLVYDGHVTDFNFPTLEPDDAAVMRDNAHLFRNHHYFPTPVPRRRHVVVTSVYHVLFKLGFPVLRRLLDHYDGRLSLLMDHIVGWAHADDERGPFDAAFLRRFMLAAWGPEHYLTSLVRYMLAAAALRPDPREEASAPPPGDEPLYVLSRRAAVVRDLHDCPTILDEIRGDGAGAISQSLRSQRRNYVLVLDSSGARAVRNFELDDASVLVLEEFRAPRRARDVDAEATQLVDALVELGVLRAVRAPAVVGAAAAS
jgi:radical SAM superfamily enzyme YgiQ (UPF0313 family)